MAHSTCTRLGLLACGLLSLACSACQGGGHFCVLGYTTRPNYDPTIRTVYVPIFENQSYRRDVEFELTRAVIREIEAKTPYKVVSNRDCADTELCGTILGLNKSILNRNQLNEVREAEMVLTVQVTWKHLRTGEVLSGPGKPLPEVAPLMLGPDGVPLPVEPPHQPGARDAEADLPRPRPAPRERDTLPNPTPLPHDGPGLQPTRAPNLVTAQASFVPELGESIATARKRAVDRLAVQIVSMMEMPW